jgi:hypothetical protein
MLAIVEIAVKTAEVIIINRLRKISAAKRISAVEKPPV